MFQVMTRVGFSFSLVGRKGYIHSRLITFVSGAKFKTVFQLIEFEDCASCTL